MNSVRFMLLMFLLIALTGVAGCKSTGRVQQPSGPVVINSTLPPEGSVTAQDLQALNANIRRYTEWTFDSTGSRPDGETTFTIEPATEFGSRWSRSEGQARKQFFSIDAQGNIVLHAVIAYDDNAVSQFSPPLVIAFANMPAGVEQRTESKMRVVELDNRLKQREIGTATRSIIYANDELITIDGREFRAKHLEVHFRADLKFADADEQTSLWMVPGMGVVAQTSREEIKVLGLAGKTTRRTLTLVTSPADAAAPAPK